MISKFILSKISPIFRKTIFTKFIKIICFTFPCKILFFRHVNIQNSFLMKSPILSCYYLKFQQFSCNLKNLYYRSKPFLSIVCFTKIIILIFDLCKLCVCVYFHLKIIFMIIVSPLNKMNFTFSP